MHILHRISLINLLLQLKSATNILEKKIRSLNGKKEELLRLKKQLCKVWDKLGFMIDEAAYKRIQEREDQKILMRELQSIF